MESPIVFGLITLILIWYNLHLSTSIVNYLKENGSEASLFTNGFYVRGKIFKYLPLYKEISFKKKGKIGSLYYLFYYSFMGIFFFLLLGILSVL